MAKSAPRTQAVDKPILIAELGDDVLIERNAMVYALAAALLEALGLLIFAREAHLPLTGYPNSLAVQAVRVAVLVGLLVTPIAHWRGAVRRNRRVPAARRQDYRWSIVPITLATAIVAAVLTLFAMEALHRVFIDATLSRPMYIIALSGVAGVVTYALFNWLSRSTSVTLLYLSMIGLFGTMGLAAASFDDPYWWNESFSHLGVAPSTSRLIFNWGLAFTALLLLAWQQYFMQDLQVLLDRGMISARTHRFIRIALIAMAISAGGVGIFRWGISGFINFVHILAATGLGVSVGLILVSMPWTMKFHLREFLMVSFVILGVIGLVLLFKVVGLVNLAGMQIFAAALGALWVILFVRNMELFVEIEYTKELM